jgi:Ca2+-binding RTX toxin-like protein
MATTASFSPRVGSLSVIGDTQNNQIRVNRNAAGRILVNDGAVTIQGGTATVANTSVIQVFGLAGNDTISLDETNGALPAAQLFGGAGNDPLTGGSGNDLLFGQDGNDILLGKGGDDQLFGGDGNDTLTGGAGNDQMFGQAGNDRMIWNPGDGTDLVEGGDGNDTAEVNGGNGAENFTMTANGTRVRFDRTSPAPFSLDIGTTENFVLNMNGGDDVFTAGNGLASLIQLTIDGGDGNDTITGGDGNDTLLGGTGNDVINGGRGNDVAQLGSGDDTFVWNPGDGSDTVDGGTGNDTLLFNGANVKENMVISANAGQAVLTRDVGSVTMTMANTETIDINALGAADSITVNDLSTTAVKHVAIDLSATPGSGKGDGQDDTVVINATAGDDAITITENNGVVTISGLATDVTITGFDATDKIVINGLGGDDVINAVGLGGAMQVVANGGDGADVLIGSSGNDTQNGEAGDDILIGNGGQDTLDGGTGNNTVLRGPTVAGNSAQDTFVGGAGDNIVRNAPVVASNGVTAGSPAVGAALLGQFMASSFVSPGEGHGAVPIADPSASQQPQLGLPHAA